MKGMIQMNTKISLDSVVKIINILFLIVLQRFIPDSGMGFLAVSLIILYMVYGLFFSGLYTKTAKMVAVRNSKGLNGNSRRIVKPALFYVVLTGMIVTGILFFAMQVATPKLFKVNYPIPIIIILCMFLILNGISDVLCGYHAGNGTNEVVYTICFIKSFVPIIFSLFLIRMFTEYGNKIATLLNNDMVTGAYAALGVAFVYAGTAIIACLILLVLTIYTRKYTKIEKTVRGIDSKKMVIGGFAHFNISAMMKHFFVSLSLVLSVLFYLKSVSTTELPIADAYRNIGIIFTRVLLPLLFVFVLFAEYVSKEKSRLHTDYRRDEFKMVVTRTQYMIKNSFFMLIPPIMIFTFLSASVAKVLFKGQSVLAASYLKTGGCILLLAGLAYALCNICSACEKEKMVWLVQGVSLVSQMIFLAAGFTAKAGDSMVILYSLYLYFGIQIVLSMIIVYSTARIDLLEVLLKIGKYGVAGIIMMVIYMILEKFLTMNVLLLFLSVFLGYLLYYLTLLALHGISKKDEAALKRTLNYYPVHFLRSRLRL